MTVRPRMLSDSRRYPEPLPFGSTDALFPIMPFGALAGVLKPFVSQTI